MLVCYFSFSYNLEKEDELGFSFLFFSFFPFCKLGGLLIYLVFKMEFSMRHFALSTK
jgi:hypothetical protein